MQVGSVVGERFRVDEALTDTASPAFLGTDQQSERRVVLFETSEAEAAALAPGKGLEHPNLCTLIDVLQDAGRSIVVVDHVPGETLSERLAAVGKKSPVDAVRSALRVADAISRLHEVGAVHGAITPECVIIEPEGQDAKPLLTRVPRISARFHSPERGEHGPASAADDAWAVAGLLLLMLTAADPPDGGFATETDVAVDDEAIRAALAATLSADPSEREKGVLPLKRALARWFVQHVGDETPSQPLRSSTPPPLPESQKPPPASKVPASKVPASTVPASTVPAREEPEPTNTRLVAGLAVGAVAIGLGAAWAFSALSDDEPAAGTPPEASAPVKAAAATAAPSGSTKPASIDLSEMPISGKGAGLGDKMAACVAAYLPAGAFSTSPDLNWMCGETDPRQGAEKLRKAIVEGGKGGVTPAMKSFSQLGWYDMAAYAVLRNGCCANLSALSLPEPGKDCDPLDVPLGAIATAVISQKDTKPPLDQLEKAMQCEAKGGRASVYRRQAAPTAAERAAFEDFIEHIED